MESQNIIDHLTRTGNITERGVLFVVNYISSCISSSCLSSLSAEDLERINNALSNYNPEETIGHDDIGGEFNKMAPNFISRALVHGVIDSDEIRRSFTLYKAIAKILHKKGLN
jgi:hypothetical protein